MLLFPLTPIVFPCQLIDVADVSGRFDVVTRTQSHVDSITVCQNGVIVDGLHESRLVPECAKISESLWTPGDYVLQLLLENPRPGWVSPLFWQPYPCQVIGEAHIRIEDAADAATGESGQNPLRS